MFIIALWHEEQKVINVRKPQGSDERLTFLRGHGESTILRL